LAGAGEVMQKKSIPAVFVHCEFPGHVGAAGSQRSAQTPVVVHSPSTQSVLLAHAAPYVPGVGSGYRHCCAPPIDWQTIVPGQSESLWHGPAQ
jgi:hypothetical protein